MLFMLWSCELLCISMSVGTKQQASTELQDNNNNKNICLPLSSVCQVEGDRRCDAGMSLL